MPLNIPCVVPMFGCKVIWDHFLRAVQSNQSPSLSAMIYRRTMLTVFIKQSTQSRPHLDPLALSKISSRLDFVAFPESTNGSNRASTTIRNPRSALGHDLTRSIFSTPLNTDSRISCSPVPHIREPMQPMKDIRMCIPPGCTIRCFHLSQFDHFICNTILYSCTSAQTRILVLLVFCFMDFSIYSSVVRAVSELAGGAFTRGSDNNLVAGKSSWHSDFATLAM